MSDKFVAIGEFPIFDEDEKYGLAELEEIVRVNNARIEDTGDCIPVILGHTKDGVGEVSQPPIVGWADGLKIVKLGKLNPRYAISASFRILKDCLDIVKKFPRRSIELWTQDNVIDPIALLSTSRPAKSLGLMTFSQERTGAKLVKYYEQGATMDENVIADKDTLVKLITSTIENSEIGQYVRSQMTKPDPVETADEELQEDGKEEEAMEDKAEADEKQELAEEGAPSDPPADEEKETLKEDAPGEAKPEKKSMVEQEACKHEEDEEEDDDDEEDDPRLRGLAVEAEEHPDLSTEALAKIVDDHLAEDPEYYSAGGDNTMIPDEKIVEKHAMDAVMMEDVLSRYRKDNENLRSEVEQLARELTRFGREKELFKLNTQFAFDLAEELKIVSDYSDAQFARHCDVIRSRYSEYPVNRGLGVAPVVTEEGVKPAMTLAKVNKAVELATTLKCSFEEALNQVQKGL
jgi:hypothetical protein